MQLFVRNSKKNLLSVDGAFSKFNTVRLAQLLERGEKIVIGGANVYIVYLVHL